LLNYHAVKNWDFGEIEQSYTRRDAMLYALGIGLGENPVDAGQLRFVYEKDLQTLPTMARCWAGLALVADPRTGADCLKLVQGEQHLQLFRPLPAKATIRALTGSHTQDRGVGKGAIAVVTRDLFDAASGELLAQGTNVLSCAATAALAPKGRQRPAAASTARSTEWSSRLGGRHPSLPQAALIYRLSGDYNPLHADPGIAQGAGFADRSFMDYAALAWPPCSAEDLLCVHASTIRRIAVRFTAPVFPGETLRFHIWRTSPGDYTCRARIDNEIRSYWITAS